MISDADSFNEEGLVELLALVKRRRYAFVTPTPATHARVVARADRKLGSTLTDILGWNLPFNVGETDSELVACLLFANALAMSGGKAHSRVRVSTLRGQYFLHSAFPTRDRNAIFFGPDSYRFADLIANELAGTPLRAGARIADIGIGAGVGAIVAGHMCDRADVYGSDINGAALRFARLNADAAGIKVELSDGSGLAHIPAPLDLITINPPYLVDDDGRAYRDGGGMHGSEVALQLTCEAMPALAPGGRIILYTGSAIVGGHDNLRSALQSAAGSRGCSLSYRELDPDIFGDELSKPQYAAVDRIALVAAILTCER